MVSLQRCRKLRMKGVHYSNPWTMKPLNTVPNRWHEICKLLSLVPPAEISYPKAKRRNDGPNALEHLYAMLGNPHSTHVEFLSIE